MRRAKISINANADVLARIKTVKQSGGRYRVSKKEDRTFEGIVFDSKWESEVYKILKQQLPAEAIHRQVVFTIQPKFKSADGKAVREVQYIADFVLSPTPYIPDTNPIPADVIIMDAKGHVTDIFKLKNKMFMFKYGTIIHQLKRPADVQAVIDMYNK